MQRTATSNMLALQHFQNAIAAHPNMRSRGPAFAGQDRVVAR